MGGKFNKETGLKNAFSRSDLGLATIFGSAQAQTGATSATAKDDIHNDSLSAAGGVGIIITNNTVNAEVGNAGTAKLSTPNNVVISAVDTQTDQALVQSDVSKPKTSKTTGTVNAAVDVAISIGVFKNTANATVWGDAIIDAGGTVTVNSQLIYPFVTDPSELTSTQVACSPASVPALPL
jgi:hypothetical protein